MKKILIACLGLLLFSLLSVPLSARRVTATDNFNRADSGTLGANWTATLSNMRIVSNTAHGDTSAATHTFSYYNAVTFTGNHYTQAEFAGGVDEVPQLPVRVQPGGDLYMVQFHIPNGQTFIYKYISSSFTAISSDLGNPGSAAATFKFEANGTTLKVYKNGVQMGGDTTDATLSGGQPGIGMYTTPNAAWDNWEGGDVGAGSTPCLRSLIGVGCEDWLELAASPLHALGMTSPREYGDVQQRNDRQEQYKQAKLQKVSHGGSLP